MSDELLPCVELNPGGPAEASVIWLHGLGASGHDFPPVVPELGLPEDLPVRFVFPHAPARPVTINNGFVMPAWFDVAALDGKDRDEEGVLESTEHLRRLVAREVERGVAEERIAVGGFSQGGAIALHGGLRHPRRLAGIFGLSTWLIREPSLAEEAEAANAETPLLLCHGTHDPMVPIDAGRAARERLEADGRQVEWHEYPMEHQVCLEEIEAIGAWLSRALRPV